MRWIEYQVKINETGAEKGWGPQPATRGALQPASPATENEIELNDLR